MSHGGTEETNIMALPMPNGKLAMWLFLVTEIMFFTALIGTYLILRSAIPDHPVIKWPAPEDVHLVEWIGAANTFVLILSSLTVVLAHYAATKGEFKSATMYIGITTALGCVFLGVKAIEYRSKFEHDILPGKIGELLPGMSQTRERQFHAVGMQHVERVRKQLEDTITKKTGQPDISKVTPGDVASQSEAIKDGYALLLAMKGDQLNSSDAKNPTYTSPLTPAKVGERVNALLKKHESSHELHLTPAIPNGNMWASCYFAMTGFHALHVLGGIVIFAAIWWKGFRGKLGGGDIPTLEYTGLYWHFVDIVWIFLFPLLYLV
jgi:cytochrome c oxidase subunit 3